MSDVDEDDEMEMVAIPVRAFSVLDLAIVVLDNVSTFVEDVRYVLMAHANFRTNRRYVENEMRADIEAITGGQA